MMMMMMNVRKNAMEITQVRLRFCYLRFMHIRYVTLCCSHVFLAAEALATSDMIIQCTRNKVA